MPKFQAKKATRKQKRLRLLITGQSGAGKSFSSLVLANGLLHETPPEERKILGFDTEAGRLSLKTSYFPDFDVIEWDDVDWGRKVCYKDFIEVIKYAEENKYQVLVLDSITPEWEELTERQSKMSGNSFVNWGKVKALHQEFVNAVLHSRLHVICTARSKMSYVLDSSNKPKQVGLDTKQESDFPYYMDFCFDIQSREHDTIALKDETGKFMSSPFVITERTGIEIANWLNSGINVELENYVNRIRTLFSQYEELSGERHSSADLNLTSLTKEELTQIGISLKSEVVKLQTDMESDSNETPDEIPM